MNESLINDIGKIIVFLLFLFAIFLITARSKRKLPNYLFSAFLLVSAIDLSGLFLSPPESQIIKSIKIASVLLQMPLFYLYVNSACYYNFTLKKRHFLHALPFLFFLVLLIITDVSEQSFSAFDVVAGAQYYFYIAAVFWTLKTFRKLYQENYSSNHHLIYKWILQTTILFLIGNSFVRIRYFMGDDNPFLLYLNIIVSAFALLVICWFVFSALHRPNLFTGIDKDLTLIKPVVELKEQPEQLRALLNYMATEKPYLDDKLTLRTLAKKTSLPEKQLSLLINQHFGKHFFDFINEFRIVDAKALLKEQPELTVLEILYQVGFNSKSSFYTAFKKETKLTPTTYRKSIV